MSAEQNKQAVRYFVEHFNKKDAQALSTVYSEEYVLDFPGGPKGSGVQGIIDATSDFMAAFPDLQFSVDDLFAEGDRVAWRWTMTGTHNGSLGPFPASGKPVSLPGISLFRLRGGKIVEDKVRADILGLLQQIGVVPAPEPAGL